MLRNLALNLFLYLFIHFCICGKVFALNSDEHFEASNELVSVVVLYRHGDRSPMSTFPTDPFYNSTYWPEGYGQLLSKGVLNQYNLGKWLRKRYSVFLPEAYSAKDILVYSTDVDRTLMSAQANLAGLYPPIESDIWNDDLLWEPIPIHLLSTDDAILAMDSSCPRYEYLRTELETSDDITSILTENGDFLKQLSNFTGMNVTNLGNVGMIFQDLYIYRNHNESFLPPWIDKIDHEKLTLLAGLNFAQETFTDELRRLRSGPFFDYLINYFQNIIANDTDATKMLMFSAHDSTVASVLGGMQAFDNRPPEFTATVIWELRKKPSGEYFINVLHKRNSSDSYGEVLVNNCDFDCSFEDFQTNLEAVTMDRTSWIEGCQNSGKYKMYSWYLLIVTIVLQKLV